MLPSGRPPHGWDPDETVLDIAFPVPPGHEIFFRDNYLDRRAGDPAPFNHIGRRPDGTLGRLHDGIDVYCEFGTPLVAPFAGVVFDPSVRWKPWNRDRYGRTVAILSEERGSRGYVALLVHLARVDVRPGDRVRRGQVVGTQGDTGNAKGQRVHLHFELRTPFLYPVREAGQHRMLDILDPYPSLVAAERRRRG